MREKILIDNLTLTDDHCWARGPAGIGRHHSDFEEHSEPPGDKQTQTLEITSTKSQEMCYGVSLLLHGVTFEFITGASTFKSRDSLSSF